MKMKIALAGASGGIGRPLSLLLKRCPLISELSLFDNVDTPGIAVDLSHINTTVKVKGYLGPKNLTRAFSDADIVVVTAGVARKPNMTRDDLFETNANVVKEMAQAMSKSAPKALLAIVTNPVNAMIPVACEELRKSGVFDRNKVFGVTTLDLVRASMFIAEDKGLDPEKLKVPCIGGHADITIIPVVSQAKPKVSYTPDKLKKLIWRVQNAGTEVVEAKAGAGSATLSTAYATFRFVNSLIRGLIGRKNVIECAYVRSDVSDVKYFANPLLLGRNGIERNLGFGRLDHLERCMYKAAIPLLEKSIKKGEDFSKADRK